MILENIVDFVERHPICTTLIIIYLLLPIPFSLMQWGEHPKKIICSQENDMCKLEIYSYKHSICWDSLIATRYSHRRHCLLPQYKTTENDILLYKDIQDVVVYGDKNKYSIYFLSNNGSKVFIETYRFFDDANYKAFIIKRKVKTLQPFEYKL